MPAHDSAVATDDDQPQRCYHCFQIAEDGIYAQLNGQSLPCCCLGCKVAVETISQLHLDDFYRLRDKPGSSDANVEYAQNTSLDVELSLIHI